MTSVFEDQNKILIFFRAFYQLVFFSLFDKPSRERLIRRFSENGSIDLFVIMLVQFFRLRDVDSLRHSQILRSLFPRPLAYLDLYLTLSGEAIDANKMRTQIHALLRMRKLYFHKWHRESRLQLIFRKCRHIPEAAELVARIRKETKLYASSSDNEVASVLIFGDKSIPTFLNHEKNTLVAFLDIKRLWENTPTFFEDQKSGKYTFYDPVIALNSRLPRPHALAFPSVKCWRIKDCSLIGGYQVVQNKKLVFYEPAGDISIGYVAGIWEYVYPIEATRDQAFVEFRWKKQERHKNGFLLSGRCTRNYFHWLIEYVSKIQVYIKNREHFLKEGVPIVIDSKMPVQHEQALNIILQKYDLENVPILRLNAADQLTSFENLYVSSPPTFHPDETEIEFWKGGALNTDYLTFLRNAVLGEDETTRGNKNGKRIYLSRQNFMSRRLVNEYAVQNIFRQFGFEIVHPEKLSFTEQLNVFRDASIVAGPVGAAFANIIFCKPGTTIINLVSEPIKEYCMFSNLAKFAGCEYVYITGSPVQKREEFPSKQEWMFSPFSISPEILQKSLSSVLGAQISSDISQTGMA